MLKKIMVVLLLLIVALGSYYILSLYNSNDLELNEIRQYKLKDSQKDILNVLDIHSRLSIYDYLLDSDSKKVTIYIEIYKGGKQVKTTEILTLVLDEVKENGAAKLILNYNDKNSWRISIKENITATSIYDLSKNVKDYIEDFSSYNSSIIFLNNKAKIIKGEDLLLHISVYGKKAISIYGLNEYQNDATKLNEHEWSVVTKLRVE